MIFRKIIILFQHEFGFTVQDEINEFPILACPPGAGRCERLPPALKISFSSLKTNCLLLPWPLELQSKFEWIEQNCISISSSSHLYLKQI